MELIVLLLIIGGCAYGLHKNRTSARFPQNDWAKQFSVYYTTKSLCLYGSGFGGVSEELTGLLEPHLAPNVEQSFVVSLGNYLRDEHGRSLQRGDYPRALTEIRKFLSVNIQWANSHASLGPFIRAMHRQETGIEITEGELTVHRDELISHLNEDQEAAAMMMGRILRLNVETAFRQTFGVSYDDHVQAKHAKDSGLMRNGLSVGVTLVAEGLPRTWTGNSNPGADDVDPRTLT